MTYLIIERFEGKNPRPVYERFDQLGRLMPDGVSYITSWINDDVSECYQIIESDDRALIDKWISNWSDIVEFEVKPVITSQEARAKVMG